MMKSWLLVLTRLDLEDRPPSTMNCLFKNISYSTLMRGRLGQVLLKRACHFFCMLSPTDKDGAREYVVAHCKIDVGVF